MNGFMSLTDTPAQDARETFLQEAGWASAARHPLGQDASTRTYTRLIRPDGARAMLMDASRAEDQPCPPDADEATRLSMGWNAATRLAASRVDAFVALAGELTRRGLSAPDVIAADASRGFALLEDFGEGREFARLIERGAAEEAELYAAAGALLAELHSSPPPAVAEGHGARWPILDFDALALRTNANLFAEWMPGFDPDMRWDSEADARWNAARDELIAKAVALPRVFTLRDYHAENLLWLERRIGLARVGLLDFQDAVRGWAGWDLAMLTQDARRPVSPAAREAALSAYTSASDLSREEVEGQLAIIGTLNALRISGLFARLIHRDKKPRYGAFQARQLAHLAANLQRGEARGMADFVASVAPHILEAKA